MPQPSTTRKRKLPGPVVVQKGSYQNTGSPTIWPIFVNSNDGSGKQLTVSEGHQWPPPVGAKLIDRGGPFYTTKSYLASPRVVPYGDYRVTVSGRTEIHTGPIMPVLPGIYNGSKLDIHFPPTLESSPGQLDAKGATAIQRCKPTKSVANLGTTLAETLKEGIPALVGKSLFESKTKHLLGKGAGEFLNVSFGWMPLVSDARKAAEAIRRADDILAQYERDAGRVVRRNYYFPLEKTITEDEIYSNSFPYTFGSYFYLRNGLNGRCVRRRVVERKTWFSGAFTYYLPSDYESRNRLKELRAKADILLGTDLTPELIWNIAPWSWLTDWFANTGDVISNLQDFQTGELVMRYGYVMETVKVSDTYTHYPSGASQFKDSVTPFTFVTETKVRRPANPFGFGVSWEGLSTFQLAILSALGITRAAR